MKGGCSIKWLVQVARLAHLLLSIVEPEDLCCPITSFSYDPRCKAQLSVDSVIIRPSPQLFDLNAKSPAEKCQASHWEEASAVSFTSDPNHAAKDLHLHHFYLVQDQYGSFISRPLDCRPNVKTNHANSLARRQRGGSTKLWNTRNLFSSSSELAKKVDVVWVVIVATAATLRAASTTTGNIIVFLCALVL